jgi:uncharacterized protein
MKPRVVLLPGNGGAKIETDNWYAWVRDELRKLDFEVIATDMPDPVIAHMNIWLPFIKNELKADEKTIVIGHSTGGVAALRYLENNRLFGAIITGVNHTDLGYHEEKEAGYYDAPWEWNAIKKNAGFIEQFASTDDPYIAISEPRLIHEKLQTNYHEYSNRGHFMSPTFPEVVEAVRKKT